MVFLKLRSCISGLTGFVSYPVIPKKKDTLAKVECFFMYYVFIIVFTNKARRVFVIDVKLLRALKKRDEHANCRKDN